MRQFQKILSAVLAGALFVSMAGCTGAPAKTEASASTSAAPGSSVASNEKITLQVVDWSDSTKTLRDEFNKTYMEQHPNITIEYTVLPADQFKTTVITAIKSGTAPDLFPVPAGMKLDSEIQENIHVPMNEYLSEGFLDTFVDGSINEGINSLNGKLYNLPERAEILHSMLFYNKTLFRQAGLDPDSPPKTWDELLAACDAITKSGNGQAYGYIDSGKQLNRLEIGVRAYASIAGGKNNSIGMISLVDGKNNLNSPEMKEAFGFFQKLVKNGSLHPSSVGLAAPEARALFAQNQAGFLMQGSWCIPVWRTENPDLDFGVMALPTPNGATKPSLPNVEPPAWMGISSTCAHPQEAADYLMALYSKEFQSALVADGGFVSLIKGVNEASMTDSAMLDYYRITQEIGRAAPNPIIGNVETNAVYAQVKDVSPNLGQILQGVLSGSVTDYSKELDALAANTQTEWDRAIKAAQDAGAKVSAADFEFKNWDTTQNYTSEDYKNR